MDFEITAGSYKSIAFPFRWENIPDFCIVTGENGVGKTHLLELIDMKCSQSKANALERFKQLTVRGGIADYLPHEVFYITNLSNIDNPPAVGLSDITSEINKFLEQITRNGAFSDVSEKAYTQKIISEINRQGIDKSRLSYEQLYKVLPNDFLFANQKNIIISLSKHFLNYQLELVQLRSENKTENEIELKIGKKPWDEFNNLLQNSNLRYEITTPDGLDIRSSYKLKFRDKLSKIEIDSRDLSTGEIAILKLYCWLFITKDDFFFPKLLLLDEPDSHLHPTFIKTFIDSIYNGIVKGYGSRVIMTTHRTETISFSPEGSLFEMHANPTRIQQSTSRGKTINLLTNNLIALVSDKRPVFVEDEDDAEFYQLVISILKEDYNKFGDISPVFVPSSLGKGNPKNPGGKNSVYSWVRKLRDAGLFEVVKGIIDKDNNNIPENGVYVLNRYSLENYLLDPLVVFSVLLDNSIQPDLSLINKIRIGEEGKIKQLNDGDLNLIVSDIVNQIEDRLRPKVEDDEKETVLVEYLNGKRVFFPKWLLNRQGHHLMAAFRGRWPQVRYDKLLHHYKKVRLIPNPAKPECSRFKVRG